MSSPKAYNWTAYVDYPQYSYEYIDLDFEFNPNTVVVNAGATLNYYVWITAIVVNLLHLLVLAPKQMRSNAIFIFMIAVAFADIFSFILSFFFPENDNSHYEILPQFFTFKKHDWCLDDPWTPIDFFGQLVYTGYGLAKRLSTWLALSMAVIRTLSVMFPMSNTIQKFTSPRVSIFLIFVLTLVSFLLEARVLVWYGKIFKIEDIVYDCESDIPTGEDLKKYILVIPIQTSLYTSLQHVGFEIGLKLLPGVVYPILTIFLFRELRAIRIRRKNMRSHENQKSDNTTSLIFFMTFFFMLTEIWAAVLSIYWVLRNVTMWEVFEFLEPFQYTSHPATILVRSANSISHPIVCLLMSSQYRDTVKSVFCSNKFSKKAMKLMKLESVGSKKTDSMVSQIPPTAQS